MEYRHIVIKPQLSIPSRPQPYRGVRQSEGAPFDTRFRCAAPLLRMLLLCCEDAIFETKYSAPHRPHPSTRSGFGRIEGCGGIMLD